MRMRKLGDGQSVTFCISSEMRMRINAVAMVNPEQSLTVADILLSSILETWRRTRKNVPLWATQGIRHQCQEVIWKRRDDGTELTREDVESYMEDEARSLEQRYGTDPENDPSSLTAKLKTAEEMLQSRNEEIKKIREKCEQFGLSSLDSEANLDEERERELAPEVEEEQQVERPPRKAPAEHTLHPDVLDFAVKGVLRRNSEAFKPAFESLSRTTANHASFPVEKFPRDLLVTADFARTVIETDSGYGTPSPFCSDAYQRPVQWILTQRAAESEGARYGAHMVIVSPFEANELVEIIRTKQKNLRRPVVLRAYLPRTSLSFRSLDDLTTYTVGPSGAIDELPVPQQLILQLNLFAGQTYLNSYSQYVRLARFLGLSYRRNVREDGVIPPDAFLGWAGGPEYQACEFDASPVGLLNALFRIRRDFLSFEKTHMGQLLSGRLLRSSDFQGAERRLHEELADEVEDETAVESDGEEQGGRLRDYPDDDRMDVDMNDA
jgi:hypothetical protein